MKKPQRVCIRIDDNGTPVIDQLKHSGTEVLKPGEALVMDAADFAVSTQLAASNLIRLGPDDEAPRPGTKKRAPRATKKTPKAPLTADQFLR